MESRESKSFDWVTICISILLLTAMVMASVIAPVETTQSLTKAKNAVCDIFGAYFLLVVIACLGVSAWFAFSKYGHIRMGKDKPEYSTFSWFAMTFCAAMGTSILYWSALEWVYYIQWPPFGYTGLSQEAYEIALPYSFFHWGIPTWSIYAVGSVTLAYRYYVRKKDDLTLQGGIEGVLGSKAHGPLGTLVNTIFVLSILGGLTISYGSGIPMLANNLQNIIGRGDSFSGYLILIITMTIFFGMSTVSGLQKGMRRISNMTIWMCLALCGLYLVLGHPLFAVDNTIQSLGILSAKFPIMMTGLDAIGSGKFPQEWTVFFWAWCLCLGPWMWIFIAKISRGRSIRQMILTVILAGFASSILFFSTISNYGIKAQLDGALDVVTAMATTGVNQVISNINLSLPGGVFVLLLWFVAGYLLLMTTMDSASFTLAAATSKGLKAGQDPPKKLRALWAILLSVPPTSLLYSGTFIEGGAPLGGLQSLLIIMAVPISLTVILTLVSGVKWLCQDFGDKSKEEIIAHFSTNLQ